MAHDMETAHAFLKFRKINEVPLSGNGEKIPCIVNISVSRVELTNGDVNSGEGAYSIKIEAENEHGENLDEHDFRSFDKGHDGQILICKEKKNISFTDTVVRISLWDNKDNVCIGSNLLDFGDRFEEWIDVSLLAPVE